MGARRRVAMWLAVGVLAAVVILAASAYLLRGHVEGVLKAQTGRGLEAEVNWGAARVSLLRDFPNLTLRVEELTVVGTGAFAGDTLVSVARSRLVLDLGSVLGSLRGVAPVVVRAVELERPALRLTVLEDGSASWDILGADGAAPGGEPERGLDVSLRRLRIEDGSVSLEDGTTGVMASLTGIRQTLRGDFGRSRFVVGSQATADAVSLSLAGVPYLSRARLAVDAELDVDLAAGRLTVRENYFRLNDLELALAGWVGLGDEAGSVDLSFESPSTAFGQILSMVPAVYARDFEALQTSGSMSVAGWVRGAAVSGEVPSFAVEVAVADGRLRYPDLPLPARVQRRVAFGPAGQPAGPCAARRGAARPSAPHQPLPGPGRMALGQRPPGHPRPWQHRFRPRYPRGPGGFWRTGREQRQRRRPDPRAATDPGGGQHGAARRRHGRDRIL